MAKRSYNRIDYTKLDVTAIASSDLRKVLNNLAATVNARIKNLRASSDFEQATSDLADAYNRLLKYHSEYFTKNGNIKRSVQKVSDPDVREMIYLVRELVLKPTVAQSQKIYQEALGRNDYMELRKRWHRDKDLFAKHAGDIIAKQIASKPSDPDDEETIETEEVAGVIKSNNIDWTELSEDELSKRLGALAYQVNKYRRR